MVNHIIEVLFQGVWSSVTGGWFYDPHLSLFINTVHMYVWIFLFSFPFLIYLLFESTFKIWSIYITITTIIFIFIKIVNYQLNRLFDKNKIVQIDEKISKKRKSRKLSKSRRRKTPPSSTFEMKDEFDEIVVESIVENEEDNFELKSTNINFSEITKNSPTNRSLFKISEESLDQQLIKQQQQQQIENNKKIVSFSTIIANGPSLQDTTVSDTKLFPNTQKNESIASSSSSNKKNKKVKVRRFNSDLANKRITREEPTASSIRNENSCSSSSDSSNSESEENEEDEISKSNIDDLNRIKSINLSKILIEKSNNNNKKKKRVTRKRAKSFNYLFKTSHPTTSLVLPQNKQQQQQQQDELNYSSASSIVSLISPKSIATVTPVNKTNIKSNELEEIINIDDLKENYLTTAKKSTSTTFSSASSRSPSNSSSSSYSSIKSSQSINDNNDDDDDDEDYEKQGAKPKIRQKQRGGNMRHRRRKRVRNNKKANYYDYNDTREGSVHYFVDDNNLYRYKFNKTSTGPELVNVNDKMFNISEIPTEFHKYLKLPSIPSTNRNSFQSRRNVLRNEVTILDDKFFKPPPVPPPPPPSSAKRLNDDLFKIRQIISTDGASSTDWGGGEERGGDGSDNDAKKSQNNNIDQIESLPPPPPPPQQPTPRNSVRHEFHMRQLRSILIHRAPSSSSNQQQNSKNTDSKPAFIKLTSSSSKYKLNLTDKISIKIPFDRRSLQSMLDNNKTFKEILFICFLAFLVSFLASYIFTMNLYQDLTLVVFCFLIASCHYSLLKTCTPDSSSPTHGFNNLLSFSRSIYFCLTCSIIIILDYIVTQTNAESLDKINLKLYNYEIIKYSYILKIKTFFEYILLFQPLLFLVGLYPQINTFLITIFEQIDMNVFGGTSMQSLSSSIVSILRSLFINSILSLILFLSLFKTYNNSNNILITAGKSKFSHTIQFSLYSSFVVLFSYLTSRHSTNYTSIYNLIKRFILKIISSTINESTSKEAGEQEQQQAVKLEDPLPKKLENIVKTRLESDVLISLILFIFAFAISASTVFSTLDVQLNDILFLAIIPFGVINHYLIPNLRLEYPWSMFNQPFLKQKHWGQFEPNSLAKLCWYERVHVYMNFFEKNVFHVLVLLSTMTICVDNLFIKFGSVDSNGFLTCFLITILGTKLIRYSYCEPSKQYQLYLVAFLFNKFDVINTMADLTNVNCLLIDLYIISIILNKFYDFYDKLNFIFIYTAPWQLPWGSAFHAFAQPLSLPHSAFLFIQILISSIIGAPLMPLMGSAMFLLSYVRPIKFWEKNYNTKRIDNTNTRLQAQFDGTCVDSENLNAIFYEHLTCVLQHTLCGDIQLGRWGNVVTGDFYILSSDYLNCLVHIIEMGNGYLTFQLRGLEFKGTYCQQRELEAISEDLVDNRSCCCCKIGHLHRMLSFNTMFHSKWLAWKIIERKYIVDSYRIVDNDLSLIVNFYSLRSTLIDFYIKSSIYYLIKSTKIIAWLTNKSIKIEIDKCDSTFADYDTCFDRNLDTDYDSQLKAVTYAKFSSNYSKWIQYCCEKRFTTESTQLSEEQSVDLRKLCFLLSLACRRALITACTGGSGASAGGQQSNSIAANIISTLNNQISTLSNSSTSSTSSNTNGGFGPLNGGHTTSTADPDSLQSFQHGYYTLFKGDIRIQSAKDEWLFNDIDLLNSVIIKSVRMALRLHQDHFQFDQTDEQTLHDNLFRYDNESVITYERDPIWRNAVLNNIPSLLALRHQLTEFSDQYKVVMLNKNFLSFRVIKINKECVRSFWAGQQHELIFLRNKNQERGSIQNAKQVLRNIINSSCDQPIGYPIYVSPLTTSYSSTHDQLGKIIGAELSFKGIYQYIRNLILRIHNNCTNNCSGSSNNTVNNEEQIATNKEEQVEANYEGEVVTGVMDLSYVEHNNRIKTNPNSVAAIRSHFKAIKNQTKTLEKVIITDINQIVELETILNINKYNYQSLCSKPQWDPINGACGIIYRRHCIKNGMMLRESILPPANVLNSNSYQLCIVLVLKRFFVPIKSTGIECFQESTYL